jgi:hypothetical protein
VRQDAPEPLILCHFWRKWLATNPPTTLCRFAAARAKSGQVTAGRRALRASEAGPTGKRQVGPNWPGQALRPGRLIAYRGQRGPLGAPEPACEAVRGLGWLIGLSSPMLPGSSPARP